MAGGACAGMLTLVLLVLCAGMALIYHGPVRIDFLRDTIVQELSGAFGGHHKVAVAGIQFGMVDGMPAAHLEGMQVSDSDGRVVMSTPAASVSFDPGSLFGLRLAPTALAIAKLDLRLDIHPDGSIAIATGDSAAEPEKPAQTILPPAAVNPPSAAGGDLPAAGKAVVGAIAEMESSFAENGLLSQLQAVNITDGRMVVRHLGSGQDLVFSHLQVSAHGDGADGRQVTLNGTGPHGPLVVVITSKRSGEDYRNSVTIRDIALSDLTTIAGISGEEPKSDPKVAIALDTVLDAAKTKAEVNAAVEMGPLRFSTDGTPDGLIAVDHSALDLNWKSDSGIFTVRGLRLDSGGSRADLTGSLSPDAASPGRFALDLKSRALVLDALTKDDKPLTDLRFSLAGNLDVRAHALDLGAVGLDGPGYHVAAQIHAEDTPDGTALRWKLEAANVPARQALRIWPSIFVSDVRRYLIENMTGGMLQSIGISANMTPDALRASLAHRPVPDEALHGEYAMGNVTLTPFDGLPPLRQAEVSGLFTARTNTVNISRASMDLSNGRRLAMSEGRFVVADTARKPAEAKIGFRLQGTADAAAELLSLPPLLPENGQSIDPALVKGTVDARSTITMPLVPKQKKSDIVSTMNGTLTNLSIDKAFGNERLEAATLTVSNEKHVTTAKGEGKLFGVAASIALRQAAGEPGEVQVQFTADDAARAKRNFAAVSGLKGPVGVTVKTAVQRSGPNDTAAVSLDMTKASIDGLVPGWSKPAGKQAKLSFNYQPAASGAKLDNLVLEGSPVQAHGSLVLDEEGGVKSGHFDMFKLSPSDMLKVEIEKTATGIRTVVRGNTFDVRPFLRAGPESGKPLDTRPAARDKEVDLDLKVAILSGFNGEAMANAELHLVNAGSDIRQFGLSGSFTGEPITGKLGKPTAQGGTISISSGNAGAFLRFVDIYPRMTGGRLDLSLAGPASRQTGTMIVRDFVLHDEPAFRSMAGHVASASARDSDVTNSTGSAPLLDGDVAFTKLRAEFVREPTRITFTDAVMWGPQVGGSVNGTMDYGRDRVNLTGTFVPAYQLNNFFAQVPVLGAFLGGSKNEGLFAVSFQIAGKVSAPVLHVSPLSAIAPGFLRKIFEFRQQGMQMPEPDATAESAP